MWLCAMTMVFVSRAISENTLISLIECVRTAGGKERGVFIVRRRLAFVSERGANIIIIGRNNNKKDGLI